MARDLPMFSPPGGGHGGPPRRAAVDRDRRRAVADARRGRFDRAPPPSRLDPGADALGRELPRPQGPPARPEPQHGLRGGPLPEHRGVLGPAHGHDHDPGRHLHARLRLLRGQDRSAHLVRRRRAAPRRRGDRRARPRARRRHQRRPRRPARRRRAASSPRRSADARDEARHGRRGPDPRLQRRGRAGCGPSWTPGPTSSTTTSRPCSGSRSRSASGPAGIAACTSSRRAKAMAVEIGYPVHTKSRA